MRHFANPKRNSSFLKIPALLRVLLFASSSLVFVSPKAHALEMEAGLGVLEEGDDRGRGAAIIHMNLSKDWFGRFYLWGRSYGPVTETNGIIAAAKQVSVFGSNSLSASVGVSLMAEHTDISYKNNSSENSNYTSTNVGLMLGLHYDIMTSKTFRLSASWDSHIFAAGQAVILLVTGRKQVLGITAGITL